MDIELNFRSHVPIYVQIMDQIKHMIVTGELNPEDQLPTVRQVAADLRVNFNTIARAYRLLDEAGIISTQHGRGTYILEPKSEEDSELLRNHEMMRLTHSYLTEAHRLGFSPDEVNTTIAKNIVVWKEKGTPPTTDAM